MSCVTWCGWCHDMQTLSALLYPSHNEVVGGYICFTLSVRPAFRVRSVAPTFLVGSISYLYILSGNFRRCVACKKFSKELKCKFCQFLKICNFGFVLFWLGIWCESLVWVFMGWWWGISEQNAGVLVVLIGSLLEESTGHNEFPSQRGSNAELWCFFDVNLNKFLNKQSRCQCVSHAKFFRTRGNFHQILTTGKFLVKWVPDSEVLVRRILFY